MLPDHRRRSLLRAAPALTLLGLAACASEPRDEAASAARRTTSVPLFSSVADGAAPPPGWRPYILRPDRVKTAYSMVRRDGRVALHATADSASSGLSCAVNIDAERTPWLRWEWRVDTVHEKATVADDLREDTPARLVVAFGGDMSRLSLRDRVFFEQVELFTGNELPFATLTYVWDGELPVGSTPQYPRSGRIRYDVVESGAARAGQWLRYERNVVDDYRQVFGEAPSGPITSVGVLTDSDDLKNHTEAWYGDIGLYAQRAATAAATSAS